MFHSLLLSREQQKYTVHVELVLTDAGYFMVIISVLWAIDGKYTDSEFWLAADIHTLVKALSGHIPMLVLYAMFITKNEFIYNIFFM